MSEIEIKVGRTYRAKRPRAAGLLISPLVNDRTVKWLSKSHVQYDSPSVPFGRHYPTVTIEKFCAWADRDVTDELPDGEYASWPIKKTKSKAGAEHD